MVHSSDNVEDFNKWQLRLEELGYKNYWQDLIATDYGIPQTRNRTFMVSILGDYNYTFPKPIPLKLKLKDMLEDNVDEKYYISNDLMKHIQKTAEEHKEYTQYDRYNGEFEQLARVWKEKSPTLHTKSNEIKIYVKNATAKGYLEATDGDGIDISSRMEYHRGTVQKGKTQTLSTMCGENNGVVILGNYSRSNHEASRIVDQNYSAPTFKENHGTITATQTSDLRIRKLTPRECFRLMGVKDEDYDKVAKNQSDSSLYHLAGDSIVVNVLCHLYKQLI